MLLQVASFISRIKTLFSCIPTISAVLILLVSAQCMADVGLSTYLLGSGIPVIKKQIIETKTSSYTLQFDMLSARQVSENSDAVLLSSADGLDRITVDQRATSVDTINVYLGTRHQTYVQKGGDWAHVIIVVNNWGVLKKTSIWINDTKLLQDIRWQYAPLSWSIGCSCNTDVTGFVSGLKVINHSLSDAQITSLSISNNHIYTVRESKVDTVVCCTGALVAFILLVISGLRRCPSAMKPILQLAGCALLYVSAMMLQLDLYPYERYPNWDNFWADVRTGYNLHILSQSISLGRIPFIDPYTNLGTMVLGDSLPLITLPNLLVTFFSPQLTMYVIQYHLYVISVIGAFVYLNFLTKNRALSIIGALYFVSSPYNLSNYIFVAVSPIFYSLPIALYLIHRYLQQPSLKYLINFSLFGIYFSGMAGLYIFVVIPLTICVYGYCVNHFYLRRSFSALARHLGSLLAAFIISSFYYLVPLMKNIKDISAGQSLLGYLVEKVTTSDSTISYQSLTSLDFLIFFAKNMMPALLVPFEASGGTLYAPLFLYVLIAIYVFTSRKNNISDTKASVIGLVATSASMLVAPLVFYSPIMPSFLRGPAAGILRYHLPFISFAIVLAGIVALNELSKSPTNNFQKIFRRIILFTFFFEMLLIGVLPYLKQITSHIPSIYSNIQVTPIELFKSANLLPINFLSNHWLLLPVVNAFSLLSLFLLTRKDQKLVRSRKLITYSFVAIMPLLSVSLYHELRLQNNSVNDVLVRDSYRIDAFQHHDQCINTLIDRSDVGYRTIFTGTGHFYQSNFGRDWKTIADSELHVASKYNTLFTFREFDSPYIGIYYGLLTGRFTHAKNFPPLTNHILTNIDALKFLGIRWVVSSDQKIADPSFIYKGRCGVPNGRYNLHFSKESEGGNLFVYELKDANKVVYLVPSFSLMDNKAIFDSISIPDNQYLGRKVALIDSATFPGKPAHMLDSSVQDNVLSGRIDHVSVDINQIHIHATTNRTAIMVVSYTYRPNWKATINGARVPVYKANGGLMALEIPQGASRIELVYSDNLLLFFMLIPLIFVGILLLLQKMDH